MPARSDVFHGGIDNEELMQLIDTHQHLIYREHMRYSWTESIPALAQDDFRFEDYRDISSGSIIQSIFMETGVDEAYYQAEARFIALLMQSRPSEFVGQIASCRPEDNTGFCAWLDDSSALQVLGYRRILHTEPDDLSIGQTFRDNVRKIGALSKTFDLCFLARQLPFAYELARDCPNVTFILDHCGAPDIAGGEFTQWAGEIKRISELEHVSCKLSGLLAYCPPGAASINTIWRYVEHVLECFGPDRVLWGSDWPVVNLGEGLANWLAITQSILGMLSMNEAKAIAYQTARRIYKFD